MEDINVMFQKIANNALASAQPTGLVFGKVESESPLEIKVDQKLTLYEPQLFLTRQVLDYELEMTVDHLTEDRELTSLDVEAFAKHNHEYKGRKKFLVHNALEVGDDVVMLRDQGGQTYIIIDKVVKA